jgi:streptomycin 6-kinase
MREAQKTLHFDAHANRRQREWFAGDPAGIVGRKEADDKANVLVSR